MFRKIAVIFDMDGVLVDNSDYHVRAWNIFLKMNGVSFQQDMIKKVFGTTNKEHLEFFFNRNLSSEDILNFENQKEKIYRDIYEQDIKPVNGLISFLKELQTNHVPIAIASSAPKVNIDFVLRKLELEGFFNVVIDPSMITKGKPDPEIYLKAAGVLGFFPSDCIVIEDSHSGIHAAQDAGMKVIGMATTHKAEELPDVDLKIIDFHSINYQDLINIISLIASPNIFFNF